jgi:hypothetical protein
MVVPLIFAAASLILSGFSFLFCFAYIKRRTGRERILVELKDEVDSLILDVNEITNRDTFLVEDRVKTLKALLADTDRRIVLLSKEVNRRQSQEEVYVELGKLRSPAADPGPAVPAPPPGMGNPAQASPGAAADPAQAVLPPVRLPRSPGEAAGLPPPADSPPAAEKPLFRGKERQSPSGIYSPRVVRSAVPLTPAPPPFAEQVAGLYRAGFSSDLIAVRLGAAISEVELAIALAERRGL